MAYLRTIDGYIGNDILTSFGGFEVNKADEVVVFGNTESERAYSSRIGPSGLVDVTINGERFKAILDTGATRFIYNKGALRNRSENYIGPWEEPTNFGII